MCVASSLTSSSLKVALHTEHTSSWWMFLKWSFIWCLCLNLKTQTGQEYCLPLCASIWKLRPPLLMKPFPQMVQLYGLNWLWKSLESWIYHAGTCWIPLKGYLLLCCCIFWLSETQERQCTCKVWILSTTSRTVRNVLFYTEQEKCWGKKRDLQLLK